MLIIYYISITYIKNIEISFYICEYICDHFDSRSLFWCQVIPVFMYQCNARYLFYFWKWSKTGVFLDANALRLLIKNFKKNKFFQKFLIKCKKNTIFLAKPMRNVSDDCFCFLRVFRVCSTLNKWSGAWNPLGFPILK